MSKRICAAICLTQIVLWFSFSLAGCSSRQFTSTPRSAVEQMLLSGAVDRALEKFDLPVLKGRRVRLDFTNLKAYDVEYIKTATRARLAKIGAVLVEADDQAQYVVEVASGALGIEYKTGVLGLPALPIPNAPVPTPELAFYRSTEQTGIVKLLMFVHADHRLVAVRRCYAKCDRDERTLLGIKFQTTDDIRLGWQAADTELENH